MKEGDRIYAFDERSCKDCMIAVMIVFSKFKKVICF